MTRTDLVRTDHDTGLLTKVILWDEMVRGNASAVRFINKGHFQARVLKDGIIRGRHKFKGKGGDEPVKRNKGIIGVN